MHTTGFRGMSWVNTFFGSKFVSVGRAQHHLAPQSQSSAKGHVFFYFTTTTTATSPIATITTSTTSTTTVLLLKLAI